MEIYNEFKRDLDRVAGQLEAGSHRVYLGEVTELRSGDGDALVYVNRRYGRHTATDPSTFPEFPQAKPQPRAKRSQNLAQRPANTSKKRG